MAGNRIKGITVEIGGDTTKLQAALKKVNSEAKNTQAQLKDVEKLLKLDPGNTELLCQKQKLLSSAVSETKEKLATLKTAAEQANQALANGDISKEQYSQFVVISIFHRAKSRCAFYNNFLCFHALSPHIHSTARNHPKWSSCRIDCHPFSFFKNLPEMPDI